MANVYKSRGRLLVELAIQNEGLNSRSDCCSDSTVGLGQPENLPTTTQQNQLSLSDVGIPIEREQLGCQMELIWNNENEISINETNVNLKDDTSNSSHSSDIIDDSEADPDYLSETETPSKKRKGLKYVVIPESEQDTSNCSSSVEHDENVEPQGARLSKQRKPRKTVVKRPNLTEKDKISRNTAKHPANFVPCHCRNSCKDFTELDRKQIYDSFWAQNYTNRRKFLGKCVLLKPVKRRTVTVATNTNPRRNETRTYYLEKESYSKKVCKQFFLNTFGYKHDAVITAIVMAKKRAPLDAAVKENRGIHAKPKRDRELIEQHINSYCPAVSHYRRHNAPIMKYLPHGLTLKKMLTNFKDKYVDTPCCLEVYRQTLKDMNVSLRTPKSDLCEECSLYKQKSEDSKKENVPLPLAVLTEYAAHKLKSNLALQLYKLDVLHANDPTTNQNDTTLFYAMDLQKVIVLPIMPASKEAFFISRLATFNMTFASLKKGGECVCVVWHEEIAGRDASNLTDTIFKMIKYKRDCKHIVFWADNCTAQNKNWILYTSLVRIVNSNICGVESVTIKYLTKGHTHMVVDSVHGNIERSLNRARNVYDFDDYKTITENSRKNLRVFDIQPGNDIYKWEKKKRQPNMSKNDKDPLKEFKLNSLIEVHFQRGSRNLLYKKVNDANYIEVDFFQKRYKTTTPIEILNETRGVSHAKKQEINTKLVPLMPESRRIFWQNLKENSVEDLVTGGQINEEN